MNQKIKPSIPYILGQDSVTFVMNNQSYVLSKGDKKYESAINALREDDMDKLAGLLDISKAVVELSKGKLIIKGGEVFYDNEVLDNSLTRRLLAMHDLRLPLDAIVAFVDNLMQNPSKNSVEQLYRFLEKNELPITSDGHFLAYKKVREDYFDCHTHTVPNKPVYRMTDEEKAKYAEPQTASGVTVHIVNDETEVTMLRNKVDDNRDNTCSSGLHFCSQDYLAHFGGEHTLIVKINPKDVVSIPPDYNEAKGRTCRYVVVGELGVNVESIENQPVMNLSPAPVAPQV